MQRRDADDGGETVGCRWAPDPRTGERVKAAILTWAGILTVAVIGASVASIRMVTARRSPWLALAGIWAGLAVAGHFASGRPRAIHSALIAITLALPMAVAGLVAQTAYRRGYGAWVAGGAAFVLAAVAAALTPLIQLFLLCTVGGDCL